MTRREFVTLTGGAATGVIIPDPRLADGQQPNLFDIHSLGAGGDGGGCLLPRFGPADHVGTVLCTLNASLVLEQDRVKASPDCVIAALQLRRARYLFAVIRCFADQPCNRARRVRMNRPGMFELYGQLLHNGSRFKRARCASCRYEESDGND